jgi:hypothetical protein
MPFKWKPIRIDPPLIALGGLDLACCELMQLDSVAYGLLTDAKFRRSLFDRETFHLEGIWFQLDSHRWNSI